MSRNQKPYHGRDYLKLRLIQGATKAGVAKDLAKDEDKFRCRGPIPEEELWLWENKSALEAVIQGLKDSAAGKTKVLKMSEYAGDVDVEDLESTSGVVD